MLTEIHAYNFGELLFLGFFLAMALVSSFIPGFVTNHIDKARKIAAQAAIDAAPVNSPIAARPVPTRILARSN